MIPMTTPVPVMPSAHSGAMLTPFFEGNHCHCLLKSGSE